MDNTAYIISFIQIFLAIIAIFVAYRIPKEQTKWEKRWELYTLIDEWLNCLYEQIKDEQYEGQQLFIECFRRKFEGFSEYELKAKCQSLQKLSNSLFKGIPTDFYDSAIGSLAFLLDENFEDTDRDINEEINRWLEYQDTIESVLRKMQKQIERLI